MTMRARGSCRAWLCVLMVVAAGTGRVSRAATRTWDGGGADLLATNPQNWDGDATAPTNNDDIVLNATSGKHMTWNFTNTPVTVASWTQESGYTGTVTIATRYPGQGPFTNFDITGNLIISNGVWNHTANPANDTVERSRLKATVGGQFVLGPSGRINVDNCGFRGENRGPGGGATNIRGGSHGGQGAQMYSRPELGTTYGSIWSPTNLGSSSRGTTLAGGGAVQLDVTGAATVDGRISSLGGAEHAGAHAGGSIYLTCASISGSGTLDSSGGYAFGAGAGGRIAIVLTNGTTFGSISNRAFGGWTAIQNVNAGAGTIYLQKAGQPTGQGTLIINNNNAIPTISVTMMPGGGGGVNLNNFSEIIITNRGALGINTNTVLDFSTTNRTTYGKEQSYVALFQTNQVTIPNPLVIDGYALLITNLALSRDFTVKANSAICHPVNGELEQYKLDLNLIGNLTVEAGGEVHGTAGGYIGSKGLGLGDVLRGAAHGGMGGVHTNENYYGDLPHPPQTNTYGSIVAPTNIGSGGYGGTAIEYNGGGALRLRVSGVTTLDGTVSAIPTLTSDQYGQGAGGSVWLTTGSLTGNGTIDATGGSGHSFYAGGGGGGRISVVLSGGTSLGSVRMRAWGGRGIQHGAAGTVYRQSADGASTVILDNNSLITLTNVFTHFPPFRNATAAISNELRYASIVVTNRAKLKLLGDCEISDLALPDINAVLDLNFHTVRVHRGRHPLGGGTVANYGAIIWVPRGAVLFIK